MTSPRILVLSVDPGGSLGALFHRSLLSRGYDSTLFPVDIFFRKRSIHRPSAPVRALHRLVRPLRLARLHAAVAQELERLRPDLVICANTEVHAPVFADYRQRGGRVAIYLADDIRNHVSIPGHIRSNLAGYDVVCTPRNFSMDELRTGGARDVLYLPFGYDPALTHPPQDPIDTLKDRVVLVGTGTPERVGILSQLAPQVPLAIYGNDWKGTRLPGATFGPAITGHDLRQTFHGALACISLLQTRNRDGHQMRTFEVPACGGLLLGQRSDEHMAFFEDGKEALFFSSTDECIALCQRMAKDRAWRDAIAEAGYRRLLSSGYSYADRMETLIRHVMR